MLRVEALEVAFHGAPALAGVDLELAAGERLAVLGPSGSGKSTLLRTIAGLLRPDAGRILLHGHDLAGLPPHRRGIGLLHQDGALFPHLDVAANIAFGLRMSGTSRERRQQRTSELLELVGLAGFGRRTIGTLSGGERQRVALARALAPQPQLLLLDEPLGALDRPLRERLLADLTQLFNRLSPTVVHVTHDVSEAFTIGDRVALMRAGRIAQHAEPDNLWLHPANEWVARFLGMTNIQRRDGQLTVIRPEAIRLQPGDAALVVRTERRGAAVHIRIRLRDGEELEAVTTNPDHPRTGDRVNISIDPAGIIPL
jgi:thiamine transport system ATP-binding protein